MCKPIHHPSHAKPYLKIPSTLRQKLTICLWVIAVTESFFNIFKPPQLHPSHQIIKIKQRAKICLSNSSRPLDFRQFTHELMTTPPPPTHAKREGTIVAFLRGHAIAAVPPLREIFVFLFLFFCCGAFLCVDSVDEVLFQNKQRGGAKRSLRWSPTPPPTEIVAGGGFSVELREKGKSKRRAWSVGMSFPWFMGWQIFGRKS